MKEFQDFALSFPASLQSAPPSSKARSSSADAIRKSSVVVQTGLSDRLTGFLRRVHPTKTALNVAADTGCGSAQIEKWLEIGSLPSCVALLRLIAAYGPELLAALLETPPAWIVAALSAERAARIDAEIAQREREIEELRKSPARRGANEGR